MRISTLSPLAVPVAWAAFAVAPAAASVDRAEIDFARDIKPIFKDRCYECHGNEKQKGRLRLDVRAGVYGEDGESELITPGDPDDSILVELLELDADDPDIMPAAGDPLTADQITKIRTWVEQGADWPASADEVYAAKEDDGLGPRDLTDAQKSAETSAIDAITAKGGLAMRVAANTNVVDVNLSLLGDKVGDADLEMLRGLEPTLVWINLARTTVGDAGLATLGEFKELRRLNLSNTKVTDAGLAHLAGLENLEYLNLYGTEVSDAGIEHIKGLKGLRRLYLWQSKVTADGAKTLADAIPDVLVDRGDYVAEAIPTEESAEAKPKPKPVNDKCPISGTPVVADAVTEYQGKVVGFCCNKCKGKFEKDPTPFLAALGLDAQASAERKPINDKCPVSGADVNADAVAEHDGKLVAFCCNNCKAKFEKDAKPFLAKLGLDAQASAERKPINDKCPVSGADVKPDAVAEHDGKLVAFCCNNCKAKFEKDPTPFLAKLGLDAQASAERKPINDKCPVSGADVKPDAVAEHDGKLVAFCCNNCKAKFEKDPKPFLAKLGLDAQASAERKPINDKCPVSGADVKPDAVAEHDGKLVAFCCNNCKAKFEKDPTPFLAKLGLK